MPATRREFLKCGAAAGVSLVLPWHIGFSRAVAQIVPVLDPTTVPRYVTPLVIPPAMPFTSTLVEAGRQVRCYEIAVRQFQQQVLPSGLPATTVWSYGSVNYPATFNYPAFTVEAAADAPVRVRWINGLVDGGGNFLPHLLPVDPTLALGQPAGRGRRAGLPPDLHVDAGALRRAGPVGDPPARGSQHRGKRRLPRGVVPAAGREHPGHVRHRRHALPALPEPVPG